MILIIKIMIQTVGNKFKITKMLTFDWFYETNGLLPWTTD